MIGIPICPVVEIFRILMRSKELLDSVLTSNRDDPPRGDSLEKEICHGDFLAQLEVKAGRNCDSITTKTCLASGSLSYWELLLTLVRELGIIFVGLRNEKPFEYIETRLSIRDNRRHHEQIALPQNVGDAENEVTGGPETKYGVDQNRMMLGYKR
ncbi:hypothetical protein JTB14_030048 [Gonioctena quinquepunctata]|nr:hypothetical protein JTB14_030048 [Gonioctena quinquepunctata]